MAHSGAGAGACNNTCQPTRSPLLTFMLQDVNPPCSCPRNVADPQNMNFASTEKQASRVHAHGNGSTLHRQGCKKSFLRLLHRWNSPTTSKNASGRQNDPSTASVWRLETSKDKILKSLTTATAEIALTVTITEITKASIKTT